MDGKTWAAVIAIVLLTVLAVYGFVKSRHRKYGACSRQSCSGCPYRCKDNSKQSGQ